MQSRSWSPYSPPASPLEVGEDPVWFLYSGAAKDAPGFLSNLVTGTITLATLAISITMVVLTLAAQQLGPRLIRIFMRDLRTQAMLGLFISTVIYLLLVMRSVYGDTVPNLAVTIGTGLVLLSTVILLVFVHHLGRSIIADNVIDDVGKEIDNSAARMLPEKNGDGPKQRPRPAGDPGDLRLDGEGYIQALDHGQIVEAAREAGAVVEIDIRAGHLLIPGIAIGKVWPLERRHCGIRASRSGTDSSLDAVAPPCRISNSRSGKLSRSACARSHPASTTPIRRW